MQDEIPAGGMISKIVKMVSGKKDEKPETDPLIAEAEKFYLASLQEQKPYHRIWYRNLAYLMGLQWLDWSDGRNWMIEPPAPTWRVRMVTNLILPMVRTEASKILKSNPTIRVVPSNDSDVSRAGAKIGDRIMEAKYYEDGFQRKLYNLTMWFLCTGSSFMWSLWDGTRGKSWTEPEMGPDGLPVIGPDGKPVLQQYYEGDTIDDVSSPFETMMEPGSPEDFNEHRKLMRVKVRDVAYLKDKYGKEVKADQTKIETLYQMRISQLVSFNGEAVIPVHQNLENIAITKEYFELPSKKHPEGLHFMYAGTTMLVEPEPLDYWLNGERAIPCAKFDHMTIPGRSYGMSVIEQLAPLQSILNKMDSMVVENANQLSRPKILAPQGSLSEDTFTSEPGEVVEYIPVGGAAPTAFKPPEMPQYYFQMKDSIPGKMQDVSGIYDVGMGKLPRRATSGKAIDLLQEADDTRMGLTIRNFGSSLERIQSIKLATIGRKYRETRMIKKLGRDREMEIISFSGADLRDADTVRCVIGANLSRAAKVEIGMKLAELQMIPKDMALKIMELGDLNMAFDQEQPQIQYAQFENMGLSKGIMYPVGELEPHEIHIKNHRDFLMENYKSLPPQIKQIFSEHINQHAAMASAAITGKPPAPGQGPGPIQPPQGAEIAPTQQPQGSA